MAETAHTLIDTVLARVRDPLSLAHSRAFTMARLSDAQRFVNGAVHVVGDIATLNTLAYHCIYPVTTNLTQPPTTNLLRIDDIADSNARSLVRLKDLAHLNSIDRRWPRAVGFRPEAYLTLGRDLLILYPALPFNSTLTIVFTQMTPVLDSETIATALPDEYNNLTLQLTEAILLLKQRDLGPAQMMIQRLVQALLPDVKYEELHLPMASTELSPENIPVAEQK